MGGFFVSWGVMVGLVMLAMAQMAMAQVQVVARMVVQVVARLYHIGGKTSHRQRVGHRIVNSISWAFLC